MVAGDDEVHVRGPTVVVSVGLELEAESLRDVVDLGAEDVREERRQGLKGIRSTH